MTGQAKYKQFIKIAEKRTQRVLEDLEALGNCSNPATYLYSDHHLRQIFNAIDEKLSIVKKRLQARSPYSHIPFRLKDTATDDSCANTHLSYMGKMIPRTDLFTQEYVIHVLETGSACFTDLEQIRATVEETTLPGYPHLHLSLSIGAVLQGSADPLEEAVHRADSLMYQAKAKKNAIVLEAGPLTLRERDLRQQRKRQILIVDDSEMNRMILSEMLKGEFEILEAENGSACLDMLNRYETKISLILLDIVMPGMNGFGVLEYMNRNNLIGDIPVIMISGEDSGEVIKQAYEWGVSDYIKRPFDMEVVHRRVLNTIKLYAKQRRLVAMVTNQVFEKEKNSRMLISVLSEIVEFRNGESGMHVLNINILTTMILEQLVKKTAGSSSL